MIKTKIIKTNKATILVVGGLPEDTKIELPTNVTFNDKQGSLIYKGKDGNPVFIPLPPGKWESVGFLDKITEDVAKELVEDKYRYFPEKHQIFRNYKKPLIEPKVWFSGEGWNQSWNDPFGTATESIHSLVEANVKMKNKYGEIEPQLNSVCCGNWIPSKSNENIPECCGCPIPTSESWYQQQEWFEEEETVFTNPFLLRKIG